LTDSVGEDAKNASEFQNKSAVIQARALLQPGALSSDCCVIVTKPEVLVAFPQHGP